MKLKLKAARCISLTKYPGEEYTTQVLVLATLLTPPIAEKLRCREACYTEEGVPRTFDAYPSPHVRIEGADILLGDTSARANLVHKFKIAQPKTGGDNDTSLELRMRMHFDGSLHLADWVEKTNKAEFTLSINARQENLDFGDNAEPEAEDEDGEKIEPDQPALAPAAIMGGTHQRRKRGQIQEPVQ